MEKLQAEYLFFQECRSLGGKPDDRPIPICELNSVEKGKEMMKFLSRLDVQDLFFALVKVNTDRGSIRFRRSQIHGENPSYEVFIDIPIRGFSDSVHEKRVYKEFDDKMEWKVHEERIRLEDLIKNLLPKEFRRDAECGSVYPSDLDKKSFISIKFHAPKDHNIDPIINTFTESAERLWSEAEKIKEEVKSKEVGKRTFIEI